MSANAEKTVDSIETKPKSTTDVPDSPKMNSSKTNVHKVTKTIVSTPYIYKPVGPYRFEFCINFINIFDRKMIDFYD